MQGQVKKVVHLHARPEAGKMETVLGSRTLVGKMLASSNVNVIKNEEESGKFTNFVASISTHFLSVTITLAHVLIFVELKNIR